MEESSRKVTRPKSLLGADAALKKCLPGIVDLLNEATADPARPEKNIDEFAALVMQSAGGVSVFPDTKIVTSVQSVAFHREQIIARHPGLLPEYEAAVRVPGTLVVLLVVRYRDETGVVREEADIRNPAVRINGVAS